MALAYCYDNKERFMSEEDLKPCIECGKDCSILPVQLGDFFTLTNLRVCSGECMFLIAYNFLYENHLHRDFRNKLNTLENKEDAEERAKYQKIITDEALKDQEKYFKENSTLLSLPVPKKMTDMFLSMKPIPQTASKTCCFTRPKIEDRIKWQTKYIEDQKMKLEEAKKYLLKIENERQRTKI